MKIKPTICLLASVLLSSIVYCQPQFSQSYLVPFSFNPSLTGNFPGDYRVGGIYHNEKGNFSPLSKFTFFGEGRIMRNALPENDRLNAGLSAMGEKDVFNGIYNNYLGLMLSYYKAINEAGTEKLCMGFSATYSDKKIDPPLLIFEDQIEAWLRNGFTGINPFERHPVRYQYIDISAGINYQNVILEKYKITVGAAVLHANRPSGKLSEGAFELPSELFLQSGIDRTINTKNKLYLSSMLTYSLGGIKDNKVLASAIYQVPIKGENFGLNAGLTYYGNSRNQNTFSPVVGLKIKSIHLNFAYDIPMGKNLNKASAFESGMVLMGRFKTIS